jgi:hypothetical protein
MKYAIAFSAVLLLLAGCASSGGSAQPQQAGGQTAEQIGEQLGEPAGQQAAEQAGVRVGEKTYYGNNNCLFEEQGFQCGETRAYTENGKTYIDAKVVNRYGRPLTIKRISCVYGSTEGAFEHAYPIEVGLVDGRDYQNQDLECVDSEGNPAPAYPEFRGKLVVWFNFPDDMDMSVQHVAIASVLSS